MLDSMKKHHDRTEELLDTVTESLRVMKVSINPKKRGWAGITPLTNGLRPECLWDSGAQVSIVSQKMATQLAENGAKLIDLDRPLTLLGLGSGSLNATGRIEVDLILQDGVHRSLIAYIVPDCGYDLIIGIDFMTQYTLGCVIYYNGLVVINEHDGTFLPIHDTRFMDTERQLNTAKKVHTARVAAIKDHTASKEAALLTWWAQRSQEERDMCHLLASVKLSPGITADQFYAAIEKSEVLFLEKESPTAETTKKGDTAQTFSTTDQETSKPDKPPRKVVCEFPEIQDALDALIEEFSDVFAEGASDVGKAKGSTIRIKLVDDTPVNERNYRTPMSQRPVLQKILDELLAAGIISRCPGSAYNSPCLLIDKKNEAGVVAGQRLVIDYRKLNRAIANVVYPMPRIDDILSEYHGCQIFSVMDIRHAYYTIAIDEESKALTAFGCELGKFQFNFLPQGLKVSPAIFQECMHRELGSLKGTRTYIDDILSGHATPEGHIEQLRELWTRLRKFGYKLKLSKCEIARKRVTYTGFDVSGDGVHINKDKIEHVKKLSKPQKASDVKSLLGFTSFLRSHVPHYCDIAAPLQQLVRTGQKEGADITRFWTEVHDKSLATLKEMLLDDRVLAFPDPNKPFQLYTDASKFHMSAVLRQLDKDGNDKAIGYWSKAFRGSQLNWAALVKEARAVREGVEHFAVFILGCPVTLYCDHKPLARFLTCQTKNDMVNRWSMAIQHFQLEFKWVSSSDNVSDCLSRLIDEKLYHKHDTVEDDFSSKNMKPTQEPAQEAAKKALTAQKPEAEIELDMANLQLSDAPSRPLYIMSAVPKPLHVENLGIFIVCTNPDGLSVITSDGKIGYDEIIRLQKQDTYCQRVLKALPNTNDDNGRFMLVTGALYRIHLGDHKAKQHLNCWSLVLPKCLILTVLVNTHAELFHAGRDRMIHALETRVYWKYMTRDITNYVKGCRICRIRNMKDPILPFITLAPPSAPMKKLAVDLWSCSDGAAFTAICLHSNYPFVIPIPDKTSASAARALSEVCAQFRTPEMVLSDNGPEFIGPEFQAALQERKIKHIRSAPHSPMTNGILEKFHRYLNSCLQLSLHLTDAADWKSCALSALEAYRKCPHTATGESPLFLATGQEPTYHIDHLLPTLSKNAWHTGTTGSGLEQLRTAHALARKNAVLARLKGAVRIKNGKGRMEKLAIGDRVLKKSFYRTKTEPRWLDGYRVVSKVTDRTVYVERNFCGKPERVNTRHLRLSDPLSELVSNSHLDTIPGRSKLYFRADDLPDLEWPPIDSVRPPSPTSTTKMKEITRERHQDSGTQESASPPEKSVSPPPPADGGVPCRRSKRVAPRPRRFDDFHMNSVSICFFHHICSQSRKRKRTSCTPPADKKLRNVPDNCLLLENATECTLECCGV